MGWRLTFSDTVIRLILMKALSINETTIMLFWFAWCLFCIWRFWKFEIIIKCSFIQFCRKDTITLISRPLRMIWWRHQWTIIRIMTNICLFDHATVDLASRTKVRTDRFPREFLLPEIIACLTTDWSIYIFGTAFLSISFFNLFPIIIIFAFLMFSFIIVWANFYGSEVVMN